jgi:hypothetical protein
MDEVNCLKAHPYPSQEGNFASVAFEGICVLTIEFNQTRSIRLKKKKAFTILCFLLPLRGEFSCDFFFGICL